MSSSGDGISTAAAWALRERSVDGVGSNRLPDVSVRSEYSMVPGGLNPVADLVTTVAVAVPCGTADNLLIDMIFINRIFIKFWIADFTSLTRQTLHTNPSH